MAWDPHTRKQALDLYVTHGSVEASEQTGVPPRTIRHWANQAELAKARTQNLEAGALVLAARHNSMRQELRLRLMEKAVDMLDRIDQPHEHIVTLTGATGEGAHVERLPLDLPTATDVKSYATAFGILLDKYRMEMGESTGRTEHIGTDDIDRTYRQLVAEIGRQRTETDTPTPLD
jgi:hypothetical protein